MSAIREMLLNELGKPQDVPEGGTARIKFEIVDSAGVGIPIASLLTLKLTLYDEAVGSAVAGPYINGRNAQTILNANGCTLSEVVGPPQVTTAVLILAGLDNPVITATARREMRVAYVEWTWAGGGPGRKELTYYVLNLARV